MKIKATPAQELLQELLDYNKDTGILTWKYRDRRHFKSNRAHSIWNTRYATKEVGCPNAHGRLVFSINYSLYQVSRIIWKLVYGFDSAVDIDHKDGNPLNNRLDNLREATRSQNNANAKIRKGVASGYKGVTKERNGGKYSARVECNKKRHRIGSYDTPEEAHAAYCEAADRLHKEFARYG
jgi:hypothetical protein